MDNDVHATPRHVATTVIPVLHYRNPDAAIDLLRNVFGFTAHNVIRDEAGHVSHAELQFGHGMVMVDRAGAGELDAHLSHPGDTARPTGAIYVIVTDPLAHHARVVRAGLEIVVPLREQWYGGSDYTCRDPEGYLWSFGSYDPWWAVAPAPEHARIELPRVTPATTGVVRSG